MTIDSPPGTLPPRVDPETFRSERRFLAGRTRLEMPVLPHDTSGPILVTAGSPRNLRKAVEVYGYAIFRERSYDFPLASADDLGRQEAWLIPAPRLAAVSFVAAGAVSFEPSPDGWELHWMYLHPYARGRQAIDPHWSLFQDRYGSFTVQHPIEPAAEALLRRVGWSPPADPERETTP